MTSLRNARHLIVVAPHPDDETIAAFAAMERVRRNGFVVDVILVTDGTASHRGSRIWPAGRLKRQRLRETRREMRQFGIYAANIHALDLADGSLGNLPLSTLQKRMAHTLLPLIKPHSIIVSPSETDEHPDHRQTARALDRLVHAQQRLEYGIWCGARARTGKNLYLTCNHFMKRMAIKRYRSQNGLIRDDPTGFALSPKDLVRFSGPRETFWSTA